TCYAIVFDNSDRRPPCDKRAQAQAERTEAAASPRTSEHRRRMAVPASEPSPHLRVSGLRKRYGELEVVAGIDLELKPGECFGLLGPNGAGKTTPLRLCRGLTDPDEGTIEVLSLPVPMHAREARRRIGVVPQADNLDPDFTVA